MPQVVQANCPFCKVLLRIPAEWLDRPMRCKHCRQIFQARAQSAAPAANGLMAHRAAAPGLADLEYGFKFEAVDELVLRRSKAGPPRNGWVAAVIALVVCVGIITTAAVLAWPQISELFQAQRDSAEKDKIADITDKQSSKDKKGDKTQIVEPKVEDDTKAVKGKGTKGKKGSAISGDAFPRRALLINVSGYLLFNPLSYGTSRDNGYPGSSTAVLVDQMSRPPLNIPATQVIELADGARKPIPPTKPVIEAAIKDFAETARAQDRIVILFTGHGIDIDKEAYLAPVEGNRDKPASLIPLAWVYDQLARCKARQKLLILDVFRYPPARGEELPGTGEMTEHFTARLESPPAGVQVWSSCSKGQQSLEFENGSLFLQALCNSLQERSKGIIEPTEALPVEALLNKVNAKMKEVLGPRKMDQLSQLFGKETQGGAAYDPTEPLAAVLEVKAGASGKAQAFVKNVIDEINIVPSPRGSRQPISLASLPVFSDKALEEYKADYKTLKELEAMAKDKDAYPLRAAYFQVQKILKDSEKIRVKEFFPSPGTPASAQVKKGILAEQQPVGIMQFELKNALEQLIKAGEKRDTEVSKRWQVNFDLAVARLKARLVYLNEYNELLAKVRGDSLPDLNPGDTGFRVGSSMKVSTKETDYKKMEKEVKKSLAAIAKNHPDTPWAIIAQRESMTALGLIWRPSRE